MTVTCLTLNPKDANVMDTWCSSWATQDSKVHIPVEYTYQGVDSSEGNDADGHIQLGADMLDTAIAAAIDADTHVYVLSHSKGSQVVGRWIMKYSATSSFSTSKLTFVTTGNPSSALGGVPWIKYPMPTDANGFTVLDIGREKDGWCRWPSGPSLLEFIGALVGMFVIHPFYGYPNGLGDVTLNSSGVPTSYQSTSTVDDTTFYTVD